ncbi:MAG: hypothetical protein LBK66_12875, partial [Spirochaetaceae bacterium]|nr:hypothetical protein [Spirochaetaceae bacterium]
KWFSGSQSLKSAGNNKGVSLSTVTNLAPMGLSYMTSLVLNTTAGEAQQAASTSSLSMPGFSSLIRVRLS